jgi:hypothetical protein
MRNNKKRDMEPENYFDSHPGQLGAKIGAGLTGLFGSPEFAYNVLEDCLHGWENSEPLWGPLIPLVGGSLLFSVTCFADAYNGDKDCPIGMFNAGLLSAGLGVYVLMNCLT